MDGFGIVMMVMGAMIAAAAQVGISRERRADWRNWEQNYDHFWRVQAREAAKKLGLPYSLT